MPRRYASPVTPPSCTSRGSGNNQGWAAEATVGSAAHVSTSEATSDNDADQPVHANVARSIIRRMDHLRFVPGCADKSESIRLNLADGGSIIGKRSPTPNPVPCLSGTAAAVKQWDKPPGKRADRWKIPFLRNFASVPDADRAPW